MKRKTCLTTVFAGILAMGATTSAAPEFVEQSPYSSQSASSPSSNPNSGQSAYPLIQSVPAAAGAAAQARGELHKARTEIHYAILDLKMDLEQSPEWRHANLRLDQAHRDYSHARAAVLDRLDQDSDYQRAMAHESAYALMISEMKKTSRPDPQSLLELAQKRMEAGAAVSAMEAMALERDGAYVSARQALVSANGDVLDMRLGLERSVRRDPHWVAARAELLDAQVRVTASSAYLNSSINARDNAVGLAVYQANQERFRPVASPYGYTGSGYDGYGYGYGNGYRGYSVGYGR